MIKRLIKKTILSATGQTSNTCIARRPFALRKGSALLPGAGLVPRPRARLPFMIKRLRSLARPALFPAGLPGAGLGLRWLLVPAGSPPASPPAPPQALGSEADRPRARESSSGRRAWPGRPESLRAPSSLADTHGRRNFPISTAVSSNQLLDQNQINLKSAHPPKRRPATVKIPT